MDLDLSTPPDSTPATSARDELSFDLGDLDETPRTAPKSAPAQAPESLDFDLGGIDLDLPATSSPAPGQTLDMGSLDLPDLDVPAPAPVPAADTMSLDDLGVDLDSIDPNDDDALQRQLELAEEFRQIGDTEGARDVLQELVAKASGPLRDRAQAMLNQLR